MSNIKFNALKKACKYQGYYKGEISMCGFKNGIPASCWKDWQECNSNNCFLISKPKEVFINQQSIFEIMPKEFGV